MTLQDQVCTLEQGKRLLELGIILPPLFYYAENKEYKKGKGFVSQGLVLSYYGTDAMFIDTENYPAYTSSELGEMLPDGDTINTRNGRLAQFNTFRNSEHNVGRLSMSSGYTVYADYKALMGTVNGYDAYRTWSQVSAPTEAQARAKMLITLLERGLTTAQDINIKNTQP